MEKLKEIGFDPIELDRGIAQQPWLAVCKELGIAAFDATPLLADSSEVGRCLHLRVGHYTRSAMSGGQWLAADLVKVIDERR